MRLLKTFPALYTVGVLLLVSTTSCQLVEDEPQSQTSETSQPTVSKEVHSEQVSVDKVIDGDTIRAHVDGRSERIRLLGIDAPELGRDGNPDERCAREATRFLDDWIANSTVTLRADPRSPERDQYDRILAYVEADGVDVGQTMLAEGFADLYTANQDLLRWSNYTDTYRDRAEPQCTDSTSH